ncbi:hypothetical protein L2E82_26889 [Cichorium intybus]|uniref:Uncharacterized protein n=1 Tax=Cichorium intybus TaxID=13427 RepID=A0ACB9CRP0_CICIN|nr:hypothetical protein L2E82_26889 [Cichorium intybus]
MSPSRPSPSPLCNILFATPTIINEQRSHSHHLLLFQPHNSYSVNVFWYFKSLTNPSRSLAQFHSTF